PCTPRSTHFPYTTLFRSESSREKPSQDFAGKDARAPNGVCAPIIAIVGPTASGKSSLGIELALRLGGEIINCDSVQVYRGIQIADRKSTRLNSSHVESSY